MECNKNHEFHEAFWWCFENYICTVIDDDRQRKKIRTCDSNEDSTSFVRSSFQLSSWATRIWNQMNSNEEAWSIDQPLLPMMGQGGEPIGAWKVWSMMVVERKCFGELLRLCSVSFHKMFRAATGKITVRRVRQKAANDVVPRRQSLSGQIHLQ
jgi:hypothetical protein